MAADPPYRGYGSQQDVRRRLNRLEPITDSVSLQVEKLAAEVASTPDPDDFDPGDLTVYFRNATI